MNVHLSEDLEKLVQAKVESGRYRSADEVISKALLALDQRDQALGEYAEGERPPAGEPEETFVPRTPLGRRLWALRKGYLAKGGQLLASDEIEAELQRRRGEAEPLDEP
jgi:putative addiction module CopG family antidote